MPLAHCSGVAAPSKWRDSGGGCVMVGCGRSASLFGKVLGSLPEGLTEPNRTLPSALAPSEPAYHASTMAAGASTQGMVTGEPLSITTMVWGLAAATAAMSAS